MGEISCKLNKPVKFIVRLPSLILICFFPHFPYTALLTEGEEIVRVCFIQSGSCNAYVKVPRAPAQTQVKVQ